MEGREDRGRWTLVAVCATTFMLLVDITIVNVARRINVDPELALRQTTQRFVRRIEEAGRLAAVRGEEWTELDLEAQDRYYEQAKKGS